MREHDPPATTPAWTFVTDNYMGIQSKYLAFADMDGDRDLDMFTDRAFYRNDGDAASLTWAPATHGLEDGCIPV